jgi:hypothetical protein
MKIPPAWIRRIKQAVFCAAVFAALFTGCEQPLGFKDALGGDVEVDTANGGGIPIAGDDTTDGGILASSGDEGE